MITEDTTHVNTCVDKHTHMNADHVYMSKEEEREREMEGERGERKREAENA